MSLSFYESTALRTEADSGKLLHEIVYIVSQAEKPHFYRANGFWSTNPDDSAPLINDGKLMDRFSIGEPVFLITQEAFEHFYINAAHKL
jgi:hypothetical protein